MGTLLGATPPRAERGAPPHGGEAPGGPAGADRLESNANNSSPLVNPRISARERRYKRRGVVWEITRLKRCQKCGRVGIDPRGVGVRKTADGVVGFSGLMTCGSVWSCPVCNAKVMARRALEIGAGITKWEAEKGAVAMVTMTMRHDAGQSLDDLWNALGYAWARVTSGKRWHQDKAQFGVIGWLRVVEVTHGVNGWHVHIHALLFMEAGRDENDLALLHAGMFSRWSNALERKGLARPETWGQDAHIVKGAGDDALAGYFTKARDDMALGQEVTNTQSKLARDAHSTVTPWELLTRVDAAEDEETFFTALDLWHEWEDGSRGRRQIAWSKGLRDRLALGREATDEQIADEVAGDKSDTVLYITPRGWQRVAAQPELAGCILDVVERDGAEGLRAVLRMFRVEYEEV